MIDDLREASEVRNIHRWDYPPINIHVCVYCYILCVRINPIQPHLSSNLVEPRCSLLAIASTCRGIEPAMLFIHTLNVIFTASAGTYAG